MGNFRTSGLKILSAELAVHLSRGRADEGHIGCQPENVTRPCLPGMGVGPRERTYFLKLRHNMILVIDLAKRKELA